MVVATYGRVWQNPSKRLVNDKNLPSGLHSHHAFMLITTHRFYKAGRAVAASILFVLCISPSALAQAVSFGGNAQHTSSYPAPAQTLNAIKWTASIDLNNTGALIHYGSPVVTAGNTVLAPVKIVNNGFRVDAFNGATGASKYSLSTDYILPDHNWIPAYGVCIATGGFGTRVYYAGIGGTIWHIDNPDSNTPGAPVREVFYTTLAGYNANAAAYNGTIFVNTPLTPDANGNIYFGFRVQGAAPAPLNTTQSGYARIDNTGHGTYVLAGTAAADANINRDSHNATPALSNDGTTVYVVVKWATNSNYGYLLGLDSTTLTTKYRVFLRDPRNSNPASIREDGTASPIVAPDGEVFLGVLGNPNTNGSRGFLLHFSPDLSIVKPPGAFGWDYTAGLVPANLVASYTGTSSYLLFCKYNEYPVGDGTGVNRVAILDPNATQIDPHPAVLGLVEMREVLTAIGPTPDPDSAGFPNAVKEYCINAPAVNPATSSVFFDSEDGHLYRWNLLTNSLDQAITLNQGIGQPYVPTVIGPDGTVYTMNGGTMFALGNSPGVNVVLGSSSPDLRAVVAGTPLTFTAVVISSPPAPTGTVTFTDLTYDGLNPVTTTLAANVPIDANGRASVTTSSLAAGGSFHGNHFITATYNGDANHSAAAMTMVQNVHANASTTQVVLSPNPSPQGQVLTISASVASVPSNAGTPTGMVTFFEGPMVIAQVPLDSGGSAGFLKSDFTYGKHTITARYAADVQFAASSGSNSVVINPTSPPSIQFSATSYAAGEGSTTLNVQVTRTGDTSGSSTVDYATSDTASTNCAVVNGRASSRCDYLPTQGTLSFANGDVSKTIKISLVDDNRAEGDENFTITISNVTTAVLGSAATATLTINDNEIVDGSGNPLDGAPFFVRQHYLDFLSREPDQSGLQFWIDQIAGNANNNPPPCANGDTNCVNTRRVNVSNAFFFELEFQQTGAFVYRLYRAAYGNNQPFPNPNSSASFPRENLKMPSYQVFAQDRATVPGGPNLAQAQLALANGFVQRSTFTSRYPASLASADLFVDAVLANLQTIGVSLTSERANLITLYNSLGRGGVMYRLADDNVQTNPINNRTFIDTEYNRAFVYTQYGGYLRRDSDIPGFMFWLDHVNSAPLRDIGKQHALVCSFITSAEYQRRFSTNVTHDNTECPH
jgi:Calx-beta domain/Bacterial Ig-like domain (group 3)